MEYHKIETLFERDPKTFKVLPDQLRNASYGIINKWEWTEKIDGTNIRVMWDGNSLAFGGRTDSAQLPAPLVQHLIETFKPEQFKEKFGETQAILYGEGYGGKIQSGSYYHQTQTFIAFDVLVDGKWWFNWENVCDVAKFFSVPTVPFMGCLSLQEAIDIVRDGFMSPLALSQTGISHPAEGLIGRTVETLFDKKHHRMIVKLKTKDFEAKEQSR